MNTEELENLEETVEDIPERVSDFIFGEEMDSIKQKIRQYIPDQVQYTSLENSLMLFLLNSEEFEAVAHAVDTLTIPEESKSAVRKIIKEDIIDDLQLLMEILNEETTEGTATITTSPTTPSSAALSRISQTFNTTATLAPTKRTYTDIPSTSSELPKSIAETLPVSPKRDIDPYRELPDEK